MSTIQVMHSALIMLTSDYICRIADLHHSLTTAVLSVIEDKWEMLDINKFQT